MLGAEAALALVAEGGAAPDNAAAPSCPCLPTRQYDAAVVEAARVKARKERAFARRETTLAALEASLAERWDKDIETLTARREAFDAAAAAAAADLARI